MNNIQYLLVLHSIDGLGPIRLKAILDYFKDPKLAWEASGSELLKIGIPKAVVDLLVETRKKLDPQKYLEDIQKSGIKWMTIFDENYPKLLKQIYDPPIVLYYKGNVECLDKKCIAVVGTRKMTGNGRSLTEQFVKNLVEAGLTIVSGLARGIDAVAHKTTVEANGQTVAVLGSGLNEIYPPENKGLAQEIINGHGAIISEFPPDYPIFPGNFPIRNRIISGLSLAVLVVEAAEDSGSLITAREALEQGRDVFTIGQIDSIKDGAMTVFEPGEILDEMGIFYKQSQADLTNLSDEERQVLQILENENMHIDEIGKKMEISAAKISATLLKMEIAGLVQNIGSGNYCRFR